MGNSWDDLTGKKPIEDGADEEEADEDEVY
jgi:hypothetical protein